MNPKLLLGLALVLLFTFTDCLYAQTDQPGTKISKVQVLGILDSIDKGLLNKDAAAVVANFATNAIITATVAEDQRTDKSTNDIQSYKNSLETGFKSFDDYLLQRKEVTVEIAPGGQNAKSQSILIETYRFAGKAERAVTQESAAFEIVGGKVLLTKMDSKVDIGEKSIVADKFDEWHGLPRAESPRFVYLVGMFKTPGHITWTNGMTLKDALNVRPLDDFARSLIRIEHTDGSVVQYNWSAEHPFTNNPFLKPGDRVISPEVFY